MSLYWLGRLGRGKEISNKNFTKFVAPGDRNGYLIEIPLQINFKTSKSGVLFFEKKNEIMHPTASNELYRY